MRGLDLEVLGRLVFEIGCENLIMLRYLFEFFLNGDNGDGRVRMEFLVWVLVLGIL